MRNFIYKSIIILICVILIYEFTIGKQIAMFKDKADSIISKEGRRESVNKLRDEINNKTDLGNEIKSIIEGGSFVSDAIINNLIEKTLNDKKKINKLILDGYPRNLDQAKNLEKIFTKINLRARIRSLLFV